MEACKLSGGYFLDLEGRQGADFLLAMKSMITLTQSMLMFFNCKALLNIKHLLKFNKFVS